MFWGHGSRPVPFLDGRRHAPVPPSATGQFPTAKHFSTFNSYSGSGEALEKNDRLMASMGVAVLVLSLALAGLLGKPAVATVTPIIPHGDWELKTGQQTITGSGNANSEVQQTVNISQTNIAKLTIELTWQDEANSARHTNTPDELGLDIKSPEGEAKSGKATNPQGGQGKVTLTYTYPVTNKSVAQKTSKLGAGAWDVVVVVGACGPQEPLIPDITGRRTIPDAGNAFTLSISYDYYARVQQAAK